MVNHYEVGPTRYQVRRILPNNTLILIYDLGRSFIISVSLKVLTLYGFSASFLSRCLVIRIHHIAELLTVGCGYSGATNVGVR